MSNKQDQHVTVRLLPDGDAHAAMLCGLNGQSLKIYLTPVPAEIRLNAGDLVEIACPKTLYLGEIYSRQDRTMIVAVEHSLDREVLALIQQVWHGPPGQ